MHPFWQTILGSRQPIHNFCEKATESLIARPGYFVSNIPYLLLGLFLLRKNDFWAKRVGIFSVLIASVSMLYDASFTFTSQVLDLAMLFLFMNYLFSYKLSQVLLLSNFQKWSILAIIQALYIDSFVLIGGNLGSIAFLLMVISTIFLEWYLQRGKKISWKNLVIAIASFVIATIIWALDSTQTFCSPFSFLQSRAVFHYMTTVSIYYIYKHLSTSSDY